MPGLPERSRKQKLHSAGQRPSQSDPFGVAVQEFEGLDNSVGMLRYFENF